MKKFAVPTSVLALILATLACTINIGGPENPNPPVAASTSDVQAMQTQAKQALETGAQSGQVTLVFTEAQLTAYLASKLEAESDPLFTDPQVYLRDGQMQIYGLAKQGNFVANISIIISVGVDETGLPTIEIVSADFGPLPVPDGLREAIASTVQEAFTGAFGPVATGLRIENINIANGLLTISGRIK